MFVCRAAGPALRRIIRRAHIIIHKREAIVDAFAKNDSKNGMLRLTQNKENDGLNAISSEGQT